MTGMTMPIPRITIGLVAAAGLLLSAVVAGGEPPADEPSDGTSDKRARQYLNASFPRTKALLAHLRREDPETFARLLDHGRAMMGDREAAALDLAREQHPELYDLLVKLRDQRPPLYRSALRDLIPQERRLQRTKMRDPDSYPFELEAWRARSRVRLAAARMAVSEGPSDAAMSDSGMKSLVDAEERAERARLERKIASYERRIAELRELLEQDQTEGTERRLKGWYRKIGKAGRGKRHGGKR